MVAKIKGYGNLVWVCESCGYSPRVIYSVDTGTTAIPAKSETIHLMDSSAPPWGVNYRTEPTTNAEPENIPQIQNIKEMENLQYMSEEVKKAESIARSLHGSTINNKSGELYIEHPKRVAERMITDEEKIVAWLHDTIEDAGYTVERARAQFGTEISEALDAVTRRDGESWMDYLKRVKENKLATSVKIADLIDNSNLSRLGVVTLADVTRQSKYNGALKYLLDENG